MDSSRKVLLIGWDAADWKVIHKLMDEGRMPNVQRLVKNGVMGNMATLFPSLSPMLWTTIATGKRPYKHGIHGFTEPTPDGKGIQPMTNLSRKCKAVWNILNQHDLKSIVVGWWPSNPAEPINGVMVSDFFHRAPRRPGASWKLMPNSVHPASMLDELSQLRVHPATLKPEHLLPFIPYAAEIDQDTDSRLASLMKILAECVTTHRAASYLLQTRDWDFAAIYYDAIDHFCHGFMKYHPPQQSNVPDEDFRVFSNVVTAGYLYHDQLLGKLLEVAGSDATVILMSDHGFHPDHLRPKGIPTEPAGPAIEHRDFGIFVVSGPGIKKDQIVHGVGLADITPTILSLYQLPVGADMDGRPLLEIYEEPPVVERISSWEEIVGNDGQHPPEHGFSTSDAKEALEQLIALGYIERPDADSSLAVAKCVCELEYNLARAFMDGGLHGEAIPLLVKLYNTYPLEFRFGLQLSNCLRAMNRISELELLVADLNSRWRIASEKARIRMSEVGNLARERRAHWQELKKIDETNTVEGRQVARLARTDFRGRPVLFTDLEKSNIRKIRTIARGNPQTLDFLAATIAASRGEFENALDLLDKAENTKSRDAGFQFQLGNVYRGLNRAIDAERAFRNALEIDEFHPGALMGLCQTYLEIGQTRKAEDFGRQAVGLKYHFPLAHFYLAKAKQSNGDIDGAIDSCNVAISQNPNFAEAHRFLAQVYSTSAKEDKLARFHRNAAKGLAVESVQYLETVEPISLKPSPLLDFESLLPEIESKNDASFIRCLGQPKPLDSTSDSNGVAVVREIVVVTGLPRSGTSMMMQVLVAGGLRAFTDEKRLADESNPKGYFESDKVKALARNNDWVADCAGQVIKVVAPLIQFLPQGLSYRVIVMQRLVDEVLESQISMLKRLNRTGSDLANDRLGEIYRGQLQNMQTLLKLHAIPFFEVDYADAIKNPMRIAVEIESFLPAQLDVDAMIQAVEPKLYRERTSKALETKPQ